MFYYVTMLFDFCKSRQALGLNISLEKPGNKLFATVIYSSSTRHYKNSTSEREVKNVVTGGKQ